MAKNYETKQIAPSVLEYKYIPNGRCHYRVTVRRKGLSMTRYVYANENTAEEISKAKEKALRLAKRIAFDLADPLTQEQIKELFYNYEHAELLLPEEAENTTNNNTNNN